MELKNQQTKVLRGKNVLDLLCDECSALGEKAFIVFADPEVKQSGLYARVVSLLNICGTQHVTFECLSKQLCSKELKTANEIARNHSVDMLLAIGNQQLSEFSQQLSLNFFEQPNQPSAHLPIISIWANQNYSFKNDCKDHRSHLVLPKPVAHFTDFEL
ncbi:hypothetical protein BCY91_05280 [Pelobium manganitolerans]|uniref:Alcohol dehydrogenase iron-type/glycerol dehydrogenase GldA domain-containing protein n=1 Tax=Pelobium manganitolerans TaxID=1842495 RepID=A0A419S615_9SPHI|nr:iron-containing alcohol dehydrogenase [Pelobium manganitolerans]RKD16284.1 hypothetical protein BCY91_05280 [Pelobium manganitolerans]